MTAYRAYRLDDRHRIKSGEWLDAETDAEAKEQAAELCQDGVASIELWQAQTKIDEIDCPPDDGKPV
jgi:hypothetical protein